MEKVQFIDLEDDDDIIISLSCSEGGKFGIDGFTIRRCPKLESILSPNDRGASISLLHISFKYSPTKRPIPAKGIIAIGQFACGIFTLSQFGIGGVSISQFTIAGFALAQVAAAYSLIAQMGIYVHEGHGQYIRSLKD